MMIAMYRHDYLRAFNGVYQAYVRVVYDTLLPTRDQNHNNRVFRLMRDDVVHTLETIGEVS